MDDFPLWQLSQGHLNDFSICPRKFQYRHLTQTGLIPLEAHQATQELGTQFHQLMQQHALGLAVTELATTHPKLTQWWQAYQQNPPPQIEGQVWSEHQRLLWVHDFALVVIYDSLVLGCDQAQILDWKTYQRPRSLEDLRQNWQTRLYLYVLAETSHYEPEQLSFTYWFPEQAAPSAADKAPAALTIPYTQACHQQTHQALASLLPRLRHSLEDYADGNDLPQVALAAGHCLSSHAGQSDCPFLAHCDRKSAPAFSDMTAIDLQTIPDVSF